VTIKLAGSEFQLSTTRILKDCLAFTRLNLDLCNFIECPRVTTLREENIKIDIESIKICLLRILNKKKRVTSTVTNLCR